MQLTTPLPDLVDIGLNLTHDSFASDIDDVLARAADTHVRYMIVTGSDLTSSRAALELVTRYPLRLRATAGVHPHHAAAFPLEHLGHLKDLLALPEIVAVGECGLDYFRNFSSREDQERAFKLQLGLAVEAAKPVFLHQRDAHEPFVSVLRDCIARIPGGVAHCFTEDIATARVYLDMGLYIGITGWLCDERRGGKLREVARYLPLDRMLLETDAPYLLPRDLDQKPASRRNEPKYLPHILATLASYRTEDPATIAAATTANAARLFGWPSTL